MQRIADELGQPTLRWIALCHARRAGAPARRSGGRRALAERASRSDRRRASQTRSSSTALSSPSIRRLPGPRRGDHRGARAERERLSRASRRCAAGLMPCAGSIVKPRPARCSSRRRATASSTSAGDARADGAGALRRRRSRRQPSTAPPRPSMSCMEPWADQFVWTGVTGYGHVRMYLGLLAAVLGSTSRPISISRSHASSTKPTACRCGRLAATRLGRSARRARGCRPRT